MKKFNVVIVGGGSTYTPALLKTICDYKDELPIQRIGLYDIDKERQEKVGQFAKILFKELYPEVEEVFYTTNIEEAFKDVDFVLMQIRAGGLSMRVHDEQIPLKHECVGQETCGAGGFAYGLRSVADIIDIVTNIRRWAKDAWIINYSNPAAIVAEATKRLFPNDNRLIHICDMPIAMMDTFASAMGTNRSDYSPRYFGLNHFGWFTALYDKNGEDILPQIKQMLVEKDVLPTESAMLDNSWKDTFKQLSVMVKDVDGYIPNTYLQYYLYPEKMVNKSDSKYTRANEVIDGREKNVFMCIQEAVDKGTTAGSSLITGVHGEYIIELLSAIINNKNKIFIVITPNKGTIENLSSDAMVEVPCLVNANGIEPLRVGPIPDFYRALLENQYTYEKLTVDAFFNQSYGDALKALTLNRTIVNVDKAKIILKELIEANGDYFPNLKLEA